jgi:hypothetical protein
VNPPPRPGANLWSIAAGPLVNVALLPILWTLRKESAVLGWDQTMPNAYVFLQAVWLINLTLLILNLLPIYPLDGAQITRSLLWFLIGRARSLMVATALGFVGMAGFVILAFWMHSVWFGVLAGFILMNCIRGLKTARELSRREKLPRYDGFACPSCGTAPPIGENWMCHQCGGKLDTFQTHAVCPHCAAKFDTTTCLECGRNHAIGEWAAPVAALFVSQKPAYFCSLAIRSCRNATPKGSTGSLA